MNLTDYFVNLNLYVGETSRDDCPKCRKAKTFTATNMGAYILYNCYHADCNFSGKVQDNINKSRTKKSLDLFCENQQTLSMLTAMVELK